MEYAWATSHAVDIIRLAQRLGAVDGLQRRADASPRTPGRGRVILHIDESWILEVAERAGHHDPSADDYGVPIAAVPRHRGELLDTPVYDGPYARAAALVHAAAGWNAPTSRGLRGRRHVPQGQ